MLASAFSVTYSLRFIHGAFFGPDPVDLPRKPHEPPSPGCASRSRSSCSPASWSACCRRRRSGPSWTSPSARCSARRRARLQPGGLARLQPAAGDEPRRAGRRRRCSTCCCSGSCAAAIDGPAADPPARGAAHLRADDGVPLLAPRATAGGTARHAAAAAAAAADRRRGRPGRRSRPSGSAASGRATCRPRPIDPVLALVWAVGARLRAGRGLAGQVSSARRADPASAAPGLVDLRHLRLVLRSRPRPDAAAGRGRDHRAAAARPALAAEALRDPRGSASEVLHAQRAACATSASRSRPAAASRRCPTR